MQSSKITYEGPTQYEILHLISCYNAAHHDVDHIRPVDFTDLDTAKAESLASLDAQSWWRNPNFDFQLDSFVRLVQDIRQASTPQDWNRVDWEKVDAGTRLLNKLIEWKISHGSFTGIVVNLERRHPEEQAQRVAAQRDGERRAQEEADKRSVERWDQAERRVREREREMATEETRQAQQAAAKKDAEKRLRKTQSNAELGRERAREMEKAAELKRQAVIVQEKREVRQSNRPFDQQYWVFKEPNWKISGIDWGKTGFFAKNRIKDNGPKLPARQQTPVIAVRSPTPGPTKLQKSNPNIPDPTKNTMYQLPVHITPNGQDRPKSPSQQPVHVIQTRPKSPAHHHHQHQHTSVNQNRAKSPTHHGQQTSGHHHQHTPINQNRPKSPGHQQPVKIPNPTRGIVYQQPVSSNTPAHQNHPKSPASHSLVNIPNPTKGTVYQQPVRPDTPGNLNKAKSTSNLKQPAANPTTASTRGSPSTPTSIASCPRPCSASRTSRWSSRSWLHPTFSAAP